MTSTESVNENRPQQTVVYQKNETKIKIPVSKVLLNQLKTNRPNQSIQRKMPVRPAPPVPTSSNNKVREAIDKFNKIQFQSNPPSFKH